MLTPSGNEGISHAGVKSGESDQMNACVSALFGTLRLQEK
jgi:hypothetical protein